MRWTLLMLWSLVGSAQAGEAAAAMRKVYYADADGDGHGDPTARRFAYGPSAGFTDSNDDCDDTDGAVNPDAPDACATGVDENCDGALDNCVIRASDALLTIDNYRYELSSLFLFLQASAAVGDFDADGSADIAMGNFPAQHGRGEAFIVLGAASGSSVLGRENTIHLSGTEHGGYFGVTVGAGDVDGDGIDDLVVGEQERAGGGAVAVFAGPIRRDSGENRADAFVVSPDSADIQTAIDLDVAPDVDGDGLADLIIGARYGSPTGAVFVQSGVISGTAMLESDATYVFEGADPHPLIGLQNVAIPDATGDGIGEIAIALQSLSGNVYVIEGGIAPGTYDVDDVAFASTPAGEFSAAAGGDYDGDGLGDLFSAGTNVSTPGYHSAAHCFLAPFSGLLATGDAAATWESQSLSVAYTSAATGDVDGDGALDVLLPGPDWVDYENDAVFVQLGLASGVVDVASLVSFAPEGGNQSFGSFVATVPDWTGDGGDEIAIGAHMAPDAAGFPSGSLYVFASDDLF